MKILGVILAAGLSKRFKGNKLIYNYNGKPLLQWTIDLLNQYAFDKLLVVNENWNEIENHFKDYSNFKIIYNHEYKKGISSSVKTAIQYALNNNYDKTLIFLGDMPLITKETVEKILYQNTKKPIVAPYYQGQKGFPTLIDKQLYKNVLDLSGDAGIKQIIYKQPELVEKIEINIPMPVFDIDTPL
ncbi:putative MobA-like protein [Marinitoga piezophila KA3]|uniref:Putative MobA-like protein n=1 Tax=Marinitoga piezophila (strain DSM 14283 / JCM 11233 / KA3) TaxID=443254 RepID=H2J446_MARPK|nr:nucleotidyltransferase family protein [Marinitoga piezophila]AEX85861.1 putative MobA-like protein [Marinitoga piezophila KA3]